MGFKTQRQYNTSLDDYEGLKEIVYKNRFFINNCDFSPPKEKGNFKFYLNKYPKVRIQITSRQFFLKLHGLKPEEFILDLKVIREFTSLVKDSYPKGIIFKFDKESVSYNDKDLIRNKLEGNNALRRTMTNKALKSREDFDKFISEQWKNIDTNLELHDSFAWIGCNFFAKCLCEEGFRCKPDGSLEYLSDVSGDSLVNDSIRILLKSGFM